ncbi:hypothetical protein EDB86DRAFT_3073846 [Lactarius hatsudake]|nr:hypothetical protein EDB86DRAFT_3073846 [Lactarius hatsudake]
MDSTVCKAAPQKRHTKPCRFFQKDTCPLSADRCDFAHVKIQILPVRYSSGHPRDIQAGQRESVQPTASMLPVDTGSEQPVAASHTVPVADSRPSKNAVSVTGRPVTEVAHGPGFSPRGSDLPPVPDRHAALLAPSSVLVPSDGLVQLIFRGGDSSPTSDVPSLSDGDSGPPSAACEAPELAERWPGSPSTFAPMVYCNPPPGMFPPSIPFTLPAAYCQLTAHKQDTRSRSRRPGISSRKLKALKTKQCKFFKKDGRCPQGSLCTFIHDPSVIRAPLSTEESPIDGSSSSARSASQSATESDDDRGRSISRSIYPITWRVIGGGVMMGGRRESCERFKEGGCPEGEDCPYTHQEEDGSDDTETLIEGPSSPIVTPRASDFPQEQMADRSTKQIALAMSPVPELVHDVSPMILSGRRLLSESRGELPPRPFSTPPRVSSRTEATRLDG